LILDDFKLDNQVAIVTGCRTGLGQGIVYGLAEAGADIIGVDYMEMEDTENTVKKLGRRFLPIQTDLTKMNSVGTILDQGLKEFGQIDILFNNAGIIRRADSVDFSEQDWDDVMNINLKVLFFLSQSVAKQMIKQGKGGKIINTASMLSFQGGIRVPSYTASKSAVMGVTKLMANEWAKDNINVNAIAPGYMATDNTAALRADEVRNKEILGRIPAGRWGNPEDLKGTAVFLASNASKYITGYTLAVDGGWLAR
jgi:2-dehydro-3-deoxy-D-gluconate 5-dehydrogenase